MQPHLLLEIGQAVPVVLLHLRLVIHNEVGVRLRVAGNTDAKVVAVLLPAGTG